MAFAPVRQPPSFQPTNQATTYETLAPNHLFAKARASERQVIVATRYGKIKVVISTLFALPSTTQQATLNNKPTNQPTNQPTTNKPTN